jgi:hypothetical protein
MKSSRWWTTHGSFVSTAAVALTATKTSAIPSRFIEPEKE